MYHVFLGAPSACDVQHDPAIYQWRKISTRSLSASTSESSVLLPPATLEAASRRISLMYQNVIFDQDKDEEDYDATKGSVHDQTTMITDFDSRSQINRKPSISRLPTQSLFLETQETQETQSYNYSDASSIARFPTFHFNLHMLTSLTSLAKTATAGSTKVTLLLAALEIEGPDTIRIKNGKDAGKEVSILKMILGDEDGSVCKLTAWREVADAWGGASDTAAAKRGDIVLLADVMASYEPKTPSRLTASPYLKSRLEICYRTIPYTVEDKRLRPDLRLGTSDPSVRKVAAVVRWFEEMAGLKV